MCPLILWRDFFIKRHTTLLFGCGLLIRASPKDYNRVGSNIWHQECWKDETVSLPSFIGSLQNSGEEIAPGQEIVQNITAIKLQLIVYTLGFQLKMG